LFHRFAYRRLKNGADLKQDASGVESKNRKKIGLKFQSLKTVNFRVNTCHFTKLLCWPTVNQKTDVCV